ncbi:MAG TPA: V-type ATP synthase subunit D [Micromonosporaceae bacterium]
MSEVRGVPPGRAGRLWLRQRLDAARGAVDLLDRELRILRGEQQRLRLLVERTGAEWTRAAGTADEWLVRAAVLAGQRELRLAVPDEPADVRLRWTAVMGVRYPVEARCEVPEPGAGQRQAGSAAVLEAAGAYRVALRAAVEHAAALGALRRVDAEVAQVRRRMRAINDRWVPRLDRALRALTDRLEENERAEAVRLRWAAARMDGEGSR